MKKKLIIIPAYNESGNIENLINDIKKTTLDCDFIIINDCSTDDTANICKKLCLPFISLPFNLGIGGAVQTGYMYAFYNDYDVAVQVDGDGQHDPKFLSTLFTEIENNSVDFVIGSRFIDNEGFQSTFLRRIGINYFSWLIKILTGKRITDPTSGFRICNRKVMEFFAKDYPADYPEPETIIRLLKNGFTLKEVPVVMKSREQGVTSINLLNSVYYMIKVSLAIAIGYFKRKDI